MGSIRYTKIKKLGKNGEVEVDGLGGTSKELLLMPAGHYINPEGMDAIVIPMAGGNNMDLVIPIMKHKDGIAAGDVFMSNGSASIHFEGSKLVINGDLEITGGSITHNGKEIGEAHKHTDSAGDKITGVE